MATAVTPCEMKSSLIISSMQISRLQPGSCKEVDVDFSILEMMFAMLECCNVRMLQSLVSDGYHRCLRKDN